MIVRNEYHTYKDLLLCLVWAVQVGEPCEVDKRGKARHLSLPLFCSLTHEEFVTYNGFNGEENHKRRIQASKGMNSVS
jgi:hypothetical protein